MIRYLLFDAANTLIHKPRLWDSMLGVLKEHGYFIDRNKLIYNHKLLSEAITFPDRTNSDFYSEFNTELLHSLGIVSEFEILNALFKKCSYLPWESFDDTRLLQSINLPMAILSNFNTSLSTIIDDKLNVKFNAIISSETEGIRKPNVEFYKLAIKKLGIRADEILYVGDSLKLDYIPAKLTGMNALVIDRVNFFPALPYVITGFDALEERINFINKA